MKAHNLIRNLALGAFVGCFILSLVEILIAYSTNFEAVFSSRVLVNAICGSIVIGFAFSLSSFIYEREDIALPFKIIFQMGIGFTVLFAVAIYLQWMPLDYGIEPILNWILISVIFAAVFWIGFRIYYTMLAKDLNRQIKNINND